MKEKVFDKLKNGFDVCLNASSYINSMDFQEYLNKYLKESERIDIKVDFLDNKLIYKYYIFRNGICIALSLTFYPKEQRTPGTVKFFDIEGETISQIDIEVIPEDLVIILNGLLLKKAIFREDGVSQLLNMGNHENELSYEISNTYSKGFSLKEFLLNE